MNFMKYCIPIIKNVNLFDFCNVAYLFRYAIPISKMSSPTISATHRIINMDITEKHAKMFVLEYRVCL